MSIPDEVARAAFGSEEPAAPYNAVANLAADFDGYAMYLNRSQDEVNTGADSVRTAANSVASAGQGEVVLTVPLDPEFAQQGLTVSALGQAPNATAELDGTTCTFHLKDASGTYEFSGASADFAGIMQASALTLTVSIPDEVARAAFGSKVPSSSVNEIASGVYEVTANLYALENGMPVFLTTLAPDGLAEVTGEIREDGAVINGGRLLATYDGTYSLSVWLDGSFTWSSLGACDSNAEGSLNIGDKNGDQASFVLQDLSGTYKFSGASVTKDGNTYSELYLAIDLANTTNWYPSNVAPYSGNEDLAPGTYTVTANLYVPGEHNPILVGYNAYMGSSDFPPTTPVSESGTLVIDEDGNATLDLPILCRAFLLKSIDSTSDTGAHVIDYTWVDETLSAFAYSTTGYISHFTFALDDLSTGLYLFDDCHEFPLPVGQDWYLPMYLRVDLANAKDANDDTKDVYDIDVTDPTGSVTLKLTTTDKVLAKKAESAVLSMSRITEGADYDSVEQQLDDMVSKSGMPFAIFNLSASLADGTSLDLAEFDSATYVLNCAFDIFGNGKFLSDCFFYFTYAGGKLQRFEGNNAYNAGGAASGQVIVDWDATASNATFVLAYASYAYTMPGNVSLEDAATGVSVAGTVTDYASPIYMQGVFDPLLVVNVDVSGERAKTVRGILDSGQAPYATYEVTTFAPTIQGKSRQREIDLWSWKNHTDAYAFSLPVASADATVYLVNVESDGSVSMTPVTELASVSSVVVANGKATVTWDAPQDLSTYYQQTAVFSALYRGATGDPDNEGYAYYAVVSNADADKIVPAEPAAASGLTYTGAEQTGVAGGEGYTLSGAYRATDAGTYTATATPAEGYTWKDGSKGAKTIEWSIAPATLTATYAGERVMRGASPAYAVDVTGFVGGETVLTAAGLTLPAIAEADRPAASELVTGFEKVLAPSGGSARNYQFKYVAGTLKVTAAAGDLKPGTYTVTANLFVPGELNAVLVGKNAYLTNPSTPLTDGQAPLTPVSDNATLTVGQDGSITLDLEVVNPVFTLQKIGGGTNAQAEVTGMGDSVGASDAAYKTRISGLSVRLGDTSGTYVFSDCLEYPTLLGQVWTVPLTLNVDFSGVDTVDPDPEPAPDPDSPTQVQAPAANVGLVYNGRTQAGVAASGAYSLTGATAKDAGTYTATATLNDGYAWADGTAGAKTVTWTIAKAKLTATYAGETVVEGGSPAYAVDVTGFVGGETALTAAGLTLPAVGAVAPGKLVAGATFSLAPAGGAAKNYTYTYVAGTLKVTAPVDTIAPGTYQITANLYVPGELNPVLGRNAYLTNASTPITDGNAPLTPVSDNARLVVRADGSRVLVIPVVNPVFTLQGAESGDNAKVLGAARSSDVVGSAQVKDRISELYVELGDDSGSYQLGACSEYPTLLGQYWDVPLRISADFSSLSRLSDSTDAAVPGDKGDSGDNGGNKGDNNGGNGQNGGGNADGNGGGNGSGTNGNSADNGNGTNGDAGNPGGYRLAAGTYTVTANIWLSDRSATGLPLMPYLTSGDFPPMYPVTGNATLTVDESGHATVRVPISIQGKVMTVSGISGLDVVGAEYSGGYVSAVTVDLGTITDMSGVITQGCSATIVMGSLASTISGITGSHTWPATFQVVFTGVPVSGNAGSSYDWGAAVNGGGALAAGVGALAATGAGASADMEFLSVATKAANAATLGAYAGDLEADAAQRTSAAYARTAASQATAALDPDASSGTDATAALALAAALSGEGVPTADASAQALSAAFLAGGDSAKKE